jgi:uncharacterized protein
VKKLRLGLALLLVGALAPAAKAAAPDSGPACAPGFPTYAPAPVTGGLVTEADVPITMSDGTVLRADITRPATGEVPTALTVTGYGRGGGAADSANGDPLTNHGYATVLVDDRGTGASGGTWDSWGERTVADYQEVLDWVVAQPWSDGRIGVTGTSYMGITALRLAATGHPAVQGVFAIVPMADAFRDIVWAGGQLNTAFIPLWMGLVTTLGMAPDATPDVLAEHAVGVTRFQLPTVVDSAAGGDSAYDGPFWRQRSPIEFVDRIDAPTFIVGGLDDIFQRGEPLLHERLRATGTDSRLLIGPWAHIEAGAGLPADGVPSLEALRLQWFDEHVKGLDAGAGCIPVVTQYVRGVEEYRSAPRWPLPGLRPERVHLRADGTLTPQPGSPTEPGRSYAQLPITGACTRSAAQWLIGAIDQTPCATDNRLDEAASLAWTSGAVDRPIEVNGPIEADIWVTTTARDASVSVAISDVAPDGTSRGLTNGLLTASHRAVDPARSRKLRGTSIQPWHPFTREALLPVVPGEPMLLQVEVFPTSFVLQPGHRLRVTIAPSDVPHALPPVPSLASSLGGVVTVLADAAHPSSVVFPVLRPTR